MATIGWVVLGFVDPPHLHKITGHTLTPLSADSVTGEFTAGALPGRTSRLPVRADLPIYTTEVGGPTRQVESRWYPGARNVVVIVGSSSAKLQETLQIVGVDHDGRTHRVGVTLPPVASSQQQVRLPVARFDRFRLQASVIKPGADWALFSAPMHPQSETLDRLGDVGRTLLTVVAAVTLLLGPGLALAALRGAKVSLVTVGLPGLLVVSGIGAAVWIGAGLAEVNKHDTGSPNIAAAILTGVLALAVAVTLAIRPLPRMSRTVWLTLGVYALLVLIVGGRGMWSPGPTGETFGGTATRTMEIGPRADPRLPYSGALTVLDGVSPSNLPRTAGFGFNVIWTVGDRGPGGAVVSAPFIAGAGAKHYDKLQALPWQPIDPQGYFAYRIGLGAANLLVVPVLVGLAGAFGGRRAARIGASLAGLTPFIVHEGFFTWPKLLTAMWVLLAGYAALRRRPVLAGCCLLAGYLTHPLALLWAPSVGLLWLLAVYRNQRNRTAQASAEQKPESNQQLEPDRELEPSPDSVEPSRVGARRSGLRALGVAALGAIGMAGVVLGGLAAWTAGSRVAGHHSAFTKYFTEVNLQPVHSVHAWLQGRGESLANTFIPGWLPTKHGDLYDINMLTGPASDGEHWVLQYWMTLPFGFGLFGIPLLLIAMFLIARRHLVPFLIVVLLPLVLFAAYWGAAMTGLLREGMHPWVATLLICCAIAAAGRSRWWRVILLLATLRVVEVVTMLIGPVLVDHHPLVLPGFTVTDIAGLITMLVPVAILWIIGIRVAWDAGANKNVVDKNVASLSVGISPTTGGYTAPLDRATMD